MWNCNIKTHRFYSFIFKTNNYLLPMYQGPLRRKSDCSDGLTTILVVDPKIYIWTISKFAVSKPWPLIGKNWSPPFDIKTEHQNLRVWHVDPSQSRASMTCGSQSGALVQRDISTEKWPRSEVSRCTPKWLNMPQTRRK